MTLAREQNFDLSLSLIKGLNVLRQGGKVRFDYGDLAPLYIGGGEAVFARDILVLIDRVRKVYGEQSFKIFLTQNIEGNRAMFQFVIDNLTFTDGPFKSIVDEKMLAIHFLECEHRWNGIQARVRLFNDLNNQKAKVQISFLLRARDM